MRSEYHVSQWGRINNRKESRRIPSKHLQYLLATSFERVGRRAGSEFYNTLVSISSTSRYTLTDIVYFLALSETISAIGMVENVLRRLVGRSSILALSCQTIFKQAPRTLSSPFYHAHQKSQPFARLPYFLMDFVALAKGLASSPKCLATFLGMSIHSREWFSALPAAFDAPPYQALCLNSLLPFLP